MNDYTVLHDGSRLHSSSDVIHFGDGYIKSILGRGGKATVYELSYSQHNMTRAVKLLHPTSSRDDQNRFKSEIGIASSLNHPNIVKIYSIGMWHQLTYLEMEHVKGINLQQLLDTHGALPETLCTAITIMICKALFYAHNHSYTVSENHYSGIIHRDLKPSNIMISEKGIVKVMDFGIARPVAASYQTATGSVSGTIHYIPPEQFAGKNIIDTKYDIYSLGVILYEMVSGQKAFPQLYLTDLFQDKLKNKFIPLNHYSGNVSKQLIALVHHCMHTDNKKRAPSMDYVLKHLLKIHYSMTNISPIATTLAFMKARTNKKNILIPFAPHFSFRTTFLILFLFFSFCVISLYFLSNKSHAWINQFYPTHPFQSIQKSIPVKSSELFDFFEENEFKYEIECKQDSL